jgi:hypothetical protein
MIKAAQTYFSSIPSVFIDGCLYAVIAWLIFSQSYLGGDEAAKYVSPQLKFWLNYAIGGCGAFFGAVKMFRSTAYAEHQESKKNP